MKMKIVVTLAALAMSAMSAFAQEGLPRKVSNVDLQTLDKQATQLPCYGEKNLLIFYVDPDKHKQNEDFTIELEENHRATSPNILGFGVLNLKDTWLPNGVIRSMARKRTEKNGALVIADPNHALSNGWDLGNCNNKFVLLFIDKEGQLVFMRKGELTEQDKADFYEMIEKYK